MSGRVARAILLLFPRRVRDGHGHEIVALIEDLIAHEGRSRAGLLMRLAVDGVAQRVATITAAWTMTAVLAATTLGGLAVSDLAAASAHPDPQRATHPVSPARATHRTPHHPPRSRHRSRRSEATTVRRVRLSRR